MISLVCCEELFKSVQTSSLEIQVILEGLDIHFNFSGVKFCNTKAMTITMTGFYLL